MLIEIDFNSDEAIYIQLRNQIIMGIATSTIHEGDTLPSVRQLADNIGINMHTVNKAYNVLRQEGFLQLDRRRGAVICIDEDKLEALQDLKEQLRVLLAKGSCKNITKEEVHELVDEIYADYEQKKKEKRRLKLYGRKAIYKAGAGSAEYGTEDCSRTEASICWDRTSSFRA